jgi:hypothetical protein
MSDRNHNDGWRWSPRRRIFLDGDPNAPEPLLAGGFKEARPETWQEKIRRIAKRGPWRQ